jgi:exonuclease III
MSPPIPHASTLTLGASLYQVIRCLEQMNTDFGFLTETKINSNNYPKQVGEYKVFSTISSNEQGGLMLVYQADRNSFTIESTRDWGPNVISCDVVSGGKRWRAIGIYIPPGETNGATLGHLDAALLDYSGEILLGGDLNIDLIRLSEPSRDVKIATMLSSYGMDDMTRHFCQRTRHKNRWTWRQKRTPRYVKTRCDGIMASDRRWFRNIRIVDPPGYDSDHYMLVAEMMSAIEREHKDYLKGRKNRPQTTIPDIDTIIADQRMATLISYWEKVAPKIATVRPNWISDDTWNLTEERVCGRKNGYLTPERRLALKRRIRSGLKLGRKRRAENASNEIEALCNGGHHVEAWQIVKRWYRGATDRPPPPLRIDMITTANSYEALYTASNPVGEPIPVPTQQPVVNDGLPDIAEIKLAITRLRNGRAPGSSGIRAEDLRHWVTMHEEQFGDKTPFDTLCELVKSAFMDRDLPQDLHVAILVLLPKPNSTEFRGIGLLDTIWKFISSIINERMKKVVVFDNAVHGFRKHRGTGTAILTNKLRMQRGVAEQTMYKQVDLDLKNAYDTLDHPTTLRILEGYGVGPNIIRLLQTFWNRHTVVPRAGWYYGRAFRATRGVTQGDVVSPMIFNILLDCILKTWRRENPVMADIIQTIFYADDGLLQSLDEVSLQIALDEFTTYFKRVGLEMNARKTQSMVAVPGRILMGMTSPAYRYRMMGEGKSE